MENKIFQNTTAKPGFSSDQTAIDICSNLAIELQGENLHFKSGEMKNTLVHERILISNGPHNFKIQTRLCSESTERGTFARSVDDVQNGHSKGR